MQRGPKLKSTATKKLAGTYKECVDGQKKPLVELAKDYPIAPDWLSEPAKEFWAVDLPRVVKCGATEVDSNMFGLYCETMATFIAEQKSGVPSNAAFRSELRKQMEMLGIAGPKARLSRVTDSVSPANPFAKFK